MTFHYIEFKTFCHSTEDPDKVVEVMENIAQHELEIECNEAEGYYGNQILILEGQISRNREMDFFFDSLPENTIKQLLNTLERRIDERCNFYFRLDKEHAHDEELKLTDGENSVKVRARVESYPSKRETAVKKMKKYLEERLK
ncbi:MAG: RNA-binding domain-containing protein [Thermoplasmatota archaeon]